MKTTHALPRASTPIEHPGARVKQKAAMSAQPLPRAARSWPQQLDTLANDPVFCPLRHSASTPRLMTRALKKTDDGPAPQILTFPTHTQINHRLSDTSLWPPKVTSKMVAVLYKLCGMSIVREAEMTYSIKDAAWAINRVLAGASQMVNAEQMRTLQVLLANVYACDETQRGDLKTELCSRWDPQGK